MDRDAKVRHKGETPNPCEPMNDKYIYQRKKGGKLSPVWQFRLKIPADLIKAKVYGNKKEIKGSLGVTDKVEARRKGAMRYAALLYEFAEKRAEIAARGVRRKPDFSEVKHQETTKQARLRRFNDLTDIEAKELVLKKFLELERKYESLRNHEFRDEQGYLCEALRDEALNEIQTDLSAYEGTAKSIVPIDWSAEAVGLLREECISFDSAASGLLCSKFENFSKRLKSASVESLWRTAEALQGRNFVERDPYFKGLDKEAVAETRVRLSTSLQEVTEKFLDHKQSLVAEKTYGELQRVCRIVTDYFGAEISVSSITLDLAEEFTTFIGSIPRGFKRDGKINVRDAAREAKNDPISPKSQKDLFIEVGSLFNFACERELIDRNPFAKKILRDKLPEINKRKKQQMAVDEMQRLFTHEAYLSNVGKSPAKFWVPLLCLFHGLRANEACQLFTSDVENIEGTWCLRVEGGEDEYGNTKRLKNKSSRRIVPIHKEVIKSGFLGYATERKEQGSALLFEGLTVGKDGNKAQGLCKWFAFCRKKIVNDEPLELGGKTLHSFRHSFKDALLNHGVGLEERENLGGWSRGRKSSEGDYGDGFWIKKLKEAIDKASYKGLDLSACKEAFENFSNQSQ